MIIVTNPGSNLSEAVVSRFGLVLSPQHIVVDGESHDTRAGVTQADVDGWVASAKTHPYPLGTSAAEYVAFFREMADASRELLVVQTSRKLIQSYDASLKAAKTLRELGGDPLRVEVVDSEVTDVGTGVVTLVAAAAIDQGLPLAQAAEAARTAAAAGRVAMIPHDLEYMVKGGRASFARAWLAKLLKLRPLVTLEEGEAAVGAKVAADAERPEAIAAWLEERVGSGRPVYAAVSHADVHGEAMVLMRELERRFDVRTRMVRSISPAVYLHLGHGALVGYVAPVDGLPFEAPSWGDLS